MVLMEQQILVVVEVLVMELHHALRIVEETALIIYVDQLQLIQVKPLAVQLCLHDLYDAKIST